MSPSSAGFGDALATATGAVESVVSVDSVVSVVD